MNKTLLFSFIILFSLSFATIPYWIEKDYNTNSYTNIWLKENLTANQTIKLYIYYNGSTSYSNGYSTFVAFDDFTENYTLNADIGGQNGWVDVYNRLGFKVTDMNDSQYSAYGFNSYATGNPMYRKVFGDLQNKMFEAYYKVSSSSVGTPDNFLILYGTASDTDTQVLYTRRGAATDDDWQWQDSAGYFHLITTGIQTDTYYWYGFYQKSTSAGGIDLYFDRINKTSADPASTYISNVFGFQYPSRTVGGKVLKYIIVRNYDPSATINITIDQEEIGSWTINGDTYTNRRLVTIISDKDLTDYQINLNYSEINNENIYISDIIYQVTLDSPSNNTIDNYISIFNWTVDNMDNYECYVYIDNNSYYAGQNSTYLLAPDSANSVGNHSWYVTCNNSTASYTTQIYIYTILEKTIDLLSPNNNSINYNISNFTWNANNFIQPFSCNITIDGTTYEVEENKTTFNATNESNYYGNHNWSVFCKDNYDENNSEIYYYSIDNLPPNITLLTLNYLNVSPEYFIVNCYVDEPNVKEVWINLTSNDSYGHAGSVNATGNYDSTTNSYFAQFFWTQETGVVYNYSCYVSDIFDQTDYANNTYSTISSTPSTSSDPDYWANYTFSNVYISITSPKEQDTIPFKQYYLTFTIDQDFATPREALCKFYISYDLDYTDKTEIFSKTYTLDSSHTEIREPINTELSFLDYVGNYQRDTPSQQKVFIVCGLDNGYAGYTSTEYYVHLPSTLSLILIIATFALLIFTVYSIFYSDYGVLTSLLTLLVLLATVISFSADGISGSWYLKELIVFLYHIINILFLIGMLEIVFENKQQMESGL